ncbi:subtilase-type protease inhibitor [Saccharothrix sp. S26]|uniref:SSI family serine proteinase inhibitor n=1 Tax=Saccharothrix sp. S26 TaxID=2907215 RepID=UPI001F285194|nr:SSI family serine proteinase inhibitor [Saccharothrix sp. S26]MCE6998052.1 subtilase-type protease inhibitor [Saccharothrix sp. S26]
MAPLPFFAAIAALIPAFAAPQSGFVLSVQRGDTVQMTNLTCEPAGGLHPRADQACLALSEVDGQIDGLSTGQALCTLEYDPVRVKASGTWRGETRLFEAEYPNQCVLLAETGPVFDL